MAELPKGPPDAVKHRVWAIVALIAGILSIPFALFLVVGLTYFGTNPSNPFLGTLMVLTWLLIAGIAIGLATAVLRTTDKNEEKVLRIVARVATAMVILSVLLTTLVIYQCATADYSGIFS